MVLMLGQSLIVTDFTVIVLHAKVSPYYNVLHEAIGYFFQLIRECTTRHGTQPVCKVSDLYYLQFLR